MVEHDRRDLGGDGDATEDDSVGTAEAWLRSAARAPVVKGAGAQLRALLTPGTQLCEGRFAVKRRVGAGGMGVVYEADDGVRRSTVALKTLTQLDAGGIYRLKSEFRALAGVAHPNLVRLHELFADDGRFFFSMELVDGDHFDVWVRPQASLLDEARLRAALPQLVAAIGAIHAAGKLHRDLKPSNVLVTDDGRVVVLDFGLSVDPEPGGAGQTIADGSVSGTPGYMAPEQAAGQPATAASDLYALGVMLFEALTGRLPFAGKSGEIVAAKQRDAAPRASAFASDVPADLDALCAELLEREPAARLGADALCVRLGIDAQRPRSLGMRSHAPAAGVRSDEPAREAQLLGREAELSGLQEAYAGSLTGQSHVVVVSGESGMGKSALVEAFLSELRSGGRACVLAGRCYEQESLPFKAFDAVVDELSRYLRRLSREAAALLPRDVYALATLFPALDRVEVIAEAPRREGADAEELRRRAFAAFGELLARIRDRQPLVVFIDDVQWVDRDSTAFLRFLLSHPEPVPALLVMSHRSERARDNELLGQVLAAARKNPRLMLHELRLGQLPEQAAQQLAASLLGNARDPALAHAVACEAGGSPFFIRELSRRAQLSPSASLVTLAEAIATHVERLPPAARELLAVLSVAGRPLGAELAIAASGAGHEEIDLLRDEQLARGASVGATRAVECYHDRIRECVAGSLSPAALRAVHGQLARALALQDDPDPEQLAVHCEGAGEHAAAAQHAATAAERAAGKLAFDHAAQLFARALDLGSFAPERERQLLIARGDALANAGRGGDAADAYLRAARDAPSALSLDLKRRAAELLLVSGHVDRGRALIDEVLDELGMPAAKTHAGALASFLFQRALTRLRGLHFQERPESTIDPDELSRLDASWSCTRGFSMTDNIRGAVYQAHHLRLALRIGEPMRVARAMSMEYGFVGRLGPSTKVRADALYAQAFALAERTESPEARGFLQVMHATVALCQGQWAEAVEAGESAVRFLREVGLRRAFDSATAHFMQTCALSLRGELGRLSQLVPALVEEASQRNDVFGVVTLTSGWPNAAWLVRDEADEANRRLQVASQLWTCTGYQLQDAYLLAGHSSVSLYCGDGRQAFTRIAAEWPALQRSQVLRVQVLRALLLLQRGQAAALAARDGVVIDGLGPKDLLRTAEQTAAVVAGTGFAFRPALAASIRAAIARTRGDAEQAARELEIAAASFDAADMAMYAAAHRRRLGALIAGDEGKRLVDEATAAMRAESVVDPERMTDLFAAGS